MRKGFFAVTAFLLLAGPLSANAGVIINVADQDWDISALSASYENETSTFNAQPWWGNIDTAKSFATAYQNAVAPAGASKPLFIFDAFVSSTPIVRFVYPNNCPDCFDSGWGQDVVTDYAVATLVANVPEPGALALLSIGLLGLILQRNKRSA